MTVYAWGAGTLGQLGTGQWQDMHMPAAVQAPAPTWLVCGANHVVCCTGDSRPGKCLGSRSTALRCSWAQCAGGGLLAWGQTPLVLTGAGGGSVCSSSHHQDNHEHQTQEQQQQHPELLHASGSPRAPPPAGCCSTPAAIALPPGTRITSAAAGWDHTLLLTGGGTVLCCGDNTWGQCGVPLDTARVTRLTPVPGIPPSVRAIAAGLRHSLCLVRGAASQQQSCGCGTGAADTPGDAAVHSTVYGWGSNRHQQLGCREGHVEEGAQPQELHSRKAEQPQTEAVCCTGNHAKPKPKQRQAYWQPAPLQLLAGVQQISAGGDRSAAITAAGGVLLWGRGLCGAPSSSTPVEYNLSPCNSSSNSSSSGNREDSAEQQGQQCAPQGTVGSGSLVTTPPGVSTVVEVMPDASRSRKPEGIPAAAQVCLGWQHVVACDCLGGVWAWGSNRAGQVGTGRPTSSDKQQQQQQQQQQRQQGMYAVPQRVSLPHPAIAVAAGAEHSAAALVDGSVWCWGWAEHGQLGLGAGTGPGVTVPQDVWQPEPVQLPPGGSARQVACGAGFTMAWHVRS